ncbi:MAG: preprotein translocase subunit YajC [Methylacidiphilales bacterium]|nr:preprotein translocase subunit YajC [Candidatus Methylacidiphilales bacterium]MDW8349982.1 preprotein translocase subunit YajC [Verrucomicrobiae bacterium]
MNNLLYLAQAANPAPVPDPTVPSGPPAYTLIVQLLLFFLIFYFLLIRPSIKARKAQEKMIADIKIGDNIVFCNGILGHVTNIKDKTFIVKVDDSVKLEIQKAAVTSVLPKS